ncbi:MAG: DMT family transporter [Bacteroidales bacterium]|nr:DMT family transporter [Bacteroidales bacterium]
MTNPRRSTIYALLAVLFWSTMSSAFKISLGFMAVDQLLFWSVVFALISIGMVLLAQQKAKLIMDMSRNELLRSALMGLINPFLYYLILFEAYNILKAQEAGVLNYSWPVVLVILSVIILKQKIGWISILAILISFTGLLVISTRGNLSRLDFTEPVGVALAVGSAFLWALYWIINMKDKRESVSKIFVNMLFGFVYILLYMMLFSHIEFPSWQGLAGSAYIGAFEMGITFVFWLLALKNARNTAKVSNLIFLSPFMALFFIRIFVGEQILFTTYIGLMLIVSGILLQQVSIWHIQLVYGRLVLWKRKVGGGRN